MGDRVYAQVVCSAKDVTAFEELGFGEEEYWKSLPEGVSFLVDQEANYGNSSLSQSADAHHCRLTPYAAQGVGVEQVPKTGFARDEDEAAWQQRWPH